MKFRNYIYSKIIKLQAFLEKKNTIWIVLISIVFANVLFYNISNKTPFSTIQKRKDASGFSFHLAEKFSYFHYYTGNFPLATLNEDLKYSIEDAESEIQENGHNLIMEYKHWSRLGESARVLAFLPNSIIAGSPQNPSIKLFNSIVFVISLIVLYLGFWRVKKPLYGLILVVLINLTPFYLYEIYSNQNIFALLGSVFFMIIGLNVFVLFKKEKFYYYLLLSCISGVIIGFFSEFRNEISIVLLSLILIYLFSKYLNLLKKTFIILLCFATFFGSKQLIRYHFNKKFEKTAVLVAKAGGHVYNGKRISGHIFWHPIFCGLGDFDEDYGYEWNDKVVYRYATPILQEKYGMDIKYSDKYHLDNYYDKDSLYYIKFDEINEYEDIVKEKVLSQIKEDPFWYIAIIFKRVIRTLTVTIPIPYVGWLIFYVIYFFIKNRYWTYLKLLLVSLPLSATSIIIYSGDGATYNSVYVYFVIISMMLILYEKMQLSKLKLQ
ncbi:MAG: hypothetical protein PHP52_02070 [Bacteroidales bacterium]|nr:hypothetical protein [Bacteroidales bacterium]MDD4215851.1 hypothetical protein [Bacteroidales bacterium]MDY0140696.1 hypothetical protein [Bacteroidales bacterium]